MQLLRKIAFPFSVLYALVVCLRNVCYDLGIFSSKTFATPTISVGNLSVGGTGKTPMVALLISLLRDSHKLAVLSRGYGRKTKGFVLASPESTATEIGDEPLQLSQAFPDITVVVDEDRQRGISTLETMVRPGLILLDDAFQHRKVNPSGAILLTAYHNLYPDDWYLPTGSLRDCKSAARRADLIVVTKCPADFGEKERQLVIRKLRPREGQTVLFSSLEYDTVAKGLKANLPLHELKAKQLTLVTGIADPKPLVVYLEAEGFHFEHLAYRDHHIFNEKEVGILKGKPCVLTTEKDFMRLRGNVPGLYYIRVGHRFLFDGLSRMEAWLASL